MIFQFLQPRPTLICMAAGFIFSFSIAQEVSLNEKDTGKLPASKRVYHTVRLTTPPPVIDGKLDDDCWLTGEWSGNFTQLIPDEGAPPTYQTEIKILYDDKHIYAAMIAHDPEPDKIMRRAGLRDELTGDMMGINFDSYHDQRTGFEFTMTVYGQKIDLVLTNPMDWDVNWNAVWRGKTSITDSGWVMEIEVPLNQLRYSNAEHQVWGLHAWRWIGRLQEESDWEVQTLAGPGILYNFGELHGISQLKKSARLELLPYAVGKLTTESPNRQNPFVGKGYLWNANAGLDAKVGISSNFTLDLTVNPDFGQVESDPSVMNLTAFETFYEEKRPFFLEGKTIFEVDNDEFTQFYSRRLGQQPSYDPVSGSESFYKIPAHTTILDAVKVSGKSAGGFSLGIIQSLTAPEFAEIAPGSGNNVKTRVEPITNYLVTRLQQDYNEGTTMVGGMFTSVNRFLTDEHLQFLSHGAYTGGIDLLHQWNKKKYYMKSSLLGSYLTGTTEAITRLQQSPARYFQRPGAGYLGYDTTNTSLTGTGGRLTVGKGSGLWQYSATFSWLSPSLELNDVGYIRTSDLLQQVTHISHFVNQPVSIFRTYRLEYNHYNSWNFNGDFIGSAGTLEAEGEFKNRWSASAKLHLHSRVRETRLLRGGPDMFVPFHYAAGASLNTDPTRMLEFILEYEMRKSGQEASSEFEWEAGFVCRPVNTLKFEIMAEYSENRNDFQYVDQIAGADATRYLLGRINQETLGLTFRADFSLTPEFSIQYYGSPFVSTGRYSQFKRVTHPLHADYGNRFFPYPLPEEANGLLNFDENGDGTAEFSIENPDFSFRQFRSNLVAKWEFRPGSFVYLVWSSDRTKWDPLTGIPVGESLGKLWEVFPGNVFLVKLSYWFST